MNDQELNTLEYNDALILDKRTFFQFYCSLLKKKHLILFTFLPINDYNLPSIKIMLFLFSFSLYFSINGFFFNDETMHKVYSYNGNFKYIEQIMNIIYSSIIPSIINTILRLLSLSERNILVLKKQKSVKIFSKLEKDTKKFLRIKFIIFFILSFSMLFFFWYFISCFCGIFKNTQNILIIDTLISFGLSMIYPFLINFIPGIFRISSLRAKKKDKKILYQLSSLLSLII